LRQGNLAIPLCQTANFLRWVW